MFKKLFNLMLGVALAITSVVPMSVLGAFAAETKDYVVVDDNATSTGADNYFTFIGGSDPNGATGWSDSQDSNATGTSSVEELKTQHWTWSDNYSQVKDLSYTFTFKGTGVELVGINSRGTSPKYSIKVDQESAKDVTIKTGGSNVEDVFFSRKDLKAGQHTVTVTLPAGSKGLQVSYARVYGTEQSKNEQKLEIPHTQQSGDYNRFKFSSGWAGDASHSWSSGANTNPWYEVQFVGHKIDVFAGKNNPHGKVRYTIDGEEVGVYDLSNPSNINSTFIASFTVEEGPHTFKAEATGERGQHTRPNGNLCIDAASVIVYHNPYEVKSATFAKGAFNLIEGVSEKIELSTIDPVYASISDLTFTSNNKAVATVSEAGVIEAIANGTAEITVASKAGSFTKKLSVNVAEAIPNMGGSIVDTDKQYTQKRYNEVKDLNKSAETLTLWKNDKAVSEIALISKDSKLKNVTVTTTDLVNTNHAEITIPKENVKATFIKSTMAYNGNFLGYGDNNGRPVPKPTESNRSESNDILYQTDPIDIPFNHVQPVWVEITAPKGVAAGTYTTTLTVTADGLKEPLTFTYTVNVQDAELKDATQFKNSFDIELWQYPYASAEYYGVDAFSEEHFKILKSQMDLYKSVGGHAITTTIVEDAWGGQTYSKNPIRYPSMIRWEKKNGVMTYDYSDFDAWVDFNKKNGIGDKIVLYSIAPWHNSFTYWENGSLVRKGFSAGSSEYKSMWTHFLKDLIDHLMKKGWFDESFIGIDERGFSKAAFDLVDSVRNIHDKPLKTAGAMDRYTDKYDLALRVSDLNVGDGAASAHPAEFERLLRDRAAKGYKTTLYSCTEHVPGNFSLSNPVESYWSIINAGKKTEGFLRWAYDAWVKDPLNDVTHNSFEPGDCFLVYPGDKEDLAAGKTPQARSSVRLEKMAEAVRDVNKLRMIVEKVPSFKTKVDAIFNDISFRPVTSQRTPNRAYGYLDASEFAAVQKDAADFKKQVADITNEYVAYLENASKVVESVTINDKENNKITLGASRTLSATITPSNLIDNRIKWESDKPAVISVAEDGTITAHKVGTATITATSLLDNTKKDTIKITSDVERVDPSAQVSYYSFDDNTANDAWSAKRNGNVDTSKASFEKGKSGNALHVTKASKDGAVKIAGTSALNN